MAMPHTSVHIAHWSTTSYGITGEMTSIDIETLQAHLTLCKTPTRVAHILQQAARNVGFFLVTHVITTVLLITLLLTALVWVW
jgi:hypothetical protein